MKMTITRVTIREALHGIHLTTRNRNVIVSNCHLYSEIGSRDNQIEKVE